MSSRFTRRTAVRRLVVGGAGLALGAGALSGCGSDDEEAGGTSGGGGGGSDEPIKVGVLTDLTGAFGVVGKANQAVAQFTADEINAAGGVLGRKLELVVVDGASDPAVNARVAGQLVNRDKVDVVIGGITSAEREAVKGIITERGKTLFLWPASYEGDECGDLIWNTGAVPVQQVGPTVDHLIEEGAKTFYLCGNDYIYPRNVLKAARQSIEAGGGRVVGEEYIPISATDAPELVSKVLASKADALFEVVILPATVPFIRGVVDGGFEGKIAGTLLDESIIPLIGKQSQGLVGVQDFFLSIDDPFSKEKVEAFQERYPDLVFGSTFNSPAWYRGLHLWRLAAEKAKSVETEKVDAAMDGIGSDELIGGPARFVPGTKHCELTMYLGEMQAGGDVKVLKELGALEPTGQCGA
jgi:branched-chain amino acid transport system substrate-binding protein